MVRRVERLLEPWSGVRTAFAPDFLGRITERMTCVTKFFEIAFPWAVKIREGPGAYAGVVPQVPKLLLSAVSQFKGLHMKEVIASRLKFAPNLASYCPEQDLSASS